MSVAMKSERVCYIRGKAKEFMNKTVTKTKSSKMKLGKERGLNWWETLDILEGTDTD